MPTLHITNLSTAVLALPGGFYTDPVAAGATVDVTVDDTDAFLGLEAVSGLIARGIIRVESSTDDPNLRPVLTYTTAALPAAANFPDGTLVWDTTRQKLIVSYSDVWRDETVVIAGTTVALAALTNLPTNAIAFNTDSLTLQRYNGAAWVSCSLSNPAASQAGLPANPHFEGQLTYNDTTQSLLVCTTAGSPGTWDSVFVAPTGTTGAPPADAAALAGGAFFNTTTNRLSLHDGAAWVTLPVAHYDTAANIAVAAGAVVTAGQMGWATDTNRLAVYTGAAWFNETTVGMYAPAAGHVYNGAIVFDDTGFVNTMANHGTLRVYSTALAAWTPSVVVVPGYAGIPALPVVGDVPNGTLAIETTGGAGARLYAKIGGAWVTDL